MPSGKERVDELDHGDPEYEGEDTPESLRVAGRLADCSEGSPEDFHDADDEVEGIDLDLQLRDLSPNFSSDQKVKLLKAAWDAIGSEFASRHTQYEMFYAGARFVTTAHSYRTFDWNQACGMVDRLLSSCDLGT